MGGVGAFGGFIFPLFLGYSKDTFDNGQARGVFTYTVFSIIGIGVTLSLMGHIEQITDKK